MSQTERQIPCEFFRVEVYNTLTDNPSTWWVANASDDGYTIFDIGIQFKKWMQAEGMAGYIIGIRESPKTGFCIVAE